MTRALPTSRSWWVRDPARTPAAARKRYSRVLQLSLSCLTANAVWYYADEPRQDVEDMVALLPSASPIRLRRRAEPPLFFEPSQLFKIIPDERFPGEFKAQTLAYIYSVQVRAEAEDGSNEEVLSWHWHPLTTPTQQAPHSHVRLDHANLSVGRLHLPTRRISFEQVVLFLVDELDVVPARDDWRNIIGESIERFEKWKTWA
jgi:hypothetical protein